MREFKNFTVTQKMPENLRFLRTLANNIWWSWNADATSLFRRINPGLFRDVRYNPCILLAKIDQEHLEELSRDSSFLSHMRSVERQFKEEVLTSRYQKDSPNPRKCIAYFSMEFGLSESINIYSGGLGILAGDHLKSASDLDVPLCGIGILYDEGYFEQRLDTDGNQQEFYTKNNVYDLPITRALDENGNFVRISVPLPEGDMHAVVWRLDVGRIPLFLLDTNVPENPPELRKVTGRLYGGDRMNRLRQELLLGFGGLRALDVMGYWIQASHMNEGHAAFLGIGRMATLMRKFGLSFDEAREFVRRTSVFTTHTPVPAGNESFRMDMLYPYLKAIEADCGISAEAIRKMGVAPGDDTASEFSMTILGLNCSRFCNGVAKLHGEVERRMWQHLWRDFPVNEIHIGHVTNGIHVPTWLAPENISLLSRFLGPNWALHPISEKQIEKVDQIPDDELWHQHEALRSHLINSMRKTFEQTMIRNNATLDTLAKVRVMFDKDALTICFARRFATYKRGTLLLSDKERLKKLLNIPGCPVQIVFAGKAHPADNEGKGLITEICEFAKDPAVRGKIIFLEDYNIHMARRLVRGADVWLNTPRRPNEASGTSGMKASINGAIHVSTLDGWWPEGYSKDCGWAIGNGEEFTDTRCQDESDAQSLYALLESEIIPTFYDRPNGELPLKWIAMMKASIKMALRRFSSTRMVSDYLNGSYFPAIAEYDELSADGFSKIRSEIADRNRILGRWDKVSISYPVPDKDLSSCFAGDKFKARCRVRLSDLSPEDVNIEFYFGKLDDNLDVVDGRPVTMKNIGRTESGEYVYECAIVCEDVGAYGYSARVLPRGDSWKGLIPGYIIWAE